MNTFVDELYISGSDRLREASISKEEGTALYNVIRENDFKSSIETGCAFGVSSIFLGQAISDNGGNFHKSIDPWQSRVYGSEGVKNIGLAGLSGVCEVIEKRGDEAISKLIDDQVKIDFAFIDGHHAFDFVLVDFFLVDRILKVGGVVAFHDMWMPSIRKACRFVENNRAYKRIQVPTNKSLSTKKKIGRPGKRTVEWLMSGCSIDLYFSSENMRFFKKVEEDDRDGDHFVPF